MLRQRIASSNRVQFRKSAVVCSIISRARYHFGHGGPNGDLVCHHVVHGHIGMVGKVGSWVCVGSGFGRTVQNFQA